MGQLTLEDDPRFQVRRVAAPAPAEDQPFPPDWREAYWLAVQNDVAQNGEESTWES